jgi:hypothetical protein
VLLIVLLAGCEQSGTATRDVALTAPSPVGMQSAPAAENAQSVERPNKGQFVFTVDHIQLPPGCSAQAPAHFCPTIRSTFDGRCSIPSNFVEIGEGTGEMTHGGRVEVTWSHCTRVSPTKEITFRDGTMMMETASGDRVTFGYGIGALSLVNGAVLIDSPFIITGGTGRFEDASGGGAVHGEAPETKPADLLGGKPFEVAMTGTITYAPGRGGQ